MIPENSPWWVYIVECADGTLYSGCSNDVAKRIAAHNSGNGARYTRSRLPVKLVYQEQLLDRSSAQHREAQLKRLTRQQKITLITQKIPPPPKKYVLAFIFSDDFSRVLLIHKNRPDWQKGKMNGIGGKLETDESFLEAVVREVQEETGLMIVSSDWKLVAELEGPLFYTQVMATILPQPVPAQSMTDETVEWFDIKCLPENCIANLSWLIPLSADNLRDSQFQLARATYV